MRFRTLLVTLTVLAVLSLGAAVWAQEATPNQPVHYHINDGIFWGEPTWVAPVAYHYGTGRQFVFGEWTTPTLLSGEEADCTFSPKSTGLVVHDTAAEHPWHDNPPVRHGHGAGFTRDLTRHVIEAIPADENHWWFALQCDLYDSSGDFTWQGAPTPTPLVGTVTADPTSLAAGASFTLTGAGFTEPSFLLSVTTTPANCAGADWPASATVLTAEGAWTHSLSLAAECAAGATQVHVNYGVIDTGQQANITLTVTASQPPP